jgi:general stress protein YciG
LQPDGADREELLAGASGGGATVLARACATTEVGSGLWQEVSVAKEDRGFASMDRAKQREIASKGGKAAHQKGTAHEWTSEEAREAGRKGGMASHQRRKQSQVDEGGDAVGQSDRSESGGSGQNEQIR